MSQPHSDLFPAFGLPATIAVLLYGDHPALARRVLGSLLRHTPREWFQLRLGLNAVSDVTRAIVRQLTDQRPDTLVIDSPSNLFKCPMMRKLIHAAPLPAASWFIWFDDDSYATRGDWLHGLALAVERHPQASLLGKPYHIDVPQGIVSAIREAPWFAGRPLDRPPSLPDGHARISFPTGGFWAIRSAILHQLDWPDSRLVHSNTDFLLAEAVRQRGGTFVPFHSGVLVNQADRRSPPTTPPGL